MTTSLSKIPKVRLFYCSAVQYKLPRLTGNCSCITISGIGSHAFGSWQPSGGDKQFMWIRDALPKFFPFARPILYGYDTQLCNAYSFQRVPDIALTLVNHLRVMVNSSPTKRPLVFITHSLGGIVLKEALVCLSGSLNTRDLELLEAISGAIFFGVPNHGMVIDHLIALASGWPNQYLIEDLKEGSWYLTNLDHSFSSLSRDKSFFWGYETKESIIPVVCHPTQPVVKTHDYLRCTLA